MTATPLENALFAQRFDDGLLDVFVGLGLVLIGASWLADLIPLGAIAPALLIPFWNKTRASVVEPRMASVQFGANRDTATRRNLTRWFLFGAGVLMAEIAIFFYSRETNAPLFSGFNSVIAGVPTMLIGIGLLAGLMVGAWRFVGYAVAAVTIGFGGAALGVDTPGLLIGAAGLVVLIGGAVLMMRFLRTHARQDMDLTDG